MTLSPTTPLPRALSPLSRDQSLRSYRAILRGTPSYRAEYYLSLSRETVSAGRHPPGVFPRNGGLSWIQMCFETANAGFAQAMYEEFLKDPATVGPDWRRLFESGIVGERPGIGGNGASRRVRNAGRSEARHAAHTRRLRCRSPGTPAGTTAIKGPAAKLVANMTESLTVPTATTFRVLAVGVLEERRRRINQGLQASGRAGQNLVHPPDRLRSRSGNEAAPRDGAYPRH